MDGAQSGCQTKRMPDQLLGQSGLAVDALPTKKPRTDATVDALPTKNPRTNAEGLHKWFGRGSEASASGTSQRDGRQQDQVWQLVHMPLLDQVLPSDMTETQTWIPW